MPKESESLKQALETYERYIISSEVIGAIVDQVAFDILRGIMISINLTFDNATQASELIEQINNQEIIAQYEYLLEFDKVIKKT